MTSFANVFEPSIRAAAALGPNTGTPACRRTSATPCDERRLRPDDDELDVERAGEREQALGILGANRVALAEPRDSRAPGRRMQSS